MQSQYRVPGSRRGVKVPPPPQKKNKQRKQKNNTTQKNCPLWWQFRSLGLRCRRFVFDLKCQVDSMNGNHFLDSSGEISSDFLRSARERWAWYVQFTTLLSAAAALEALNLIGSAHTGVSLLLAKMKISNVNDDISHL